MTGSWLSATINFFFFCTDKLSLYFFSHSTGDRLHCPPLDRPYKSRALAHYPEHVQGSPFDKDAVAMVCNLIGLLILVISFRTRGMVTFVTENLKRCRIIKMFNYVHYPLNTAFPLTK